MTTTIPTTRRRGPLSRPVALGFTLLLGATTLAACANPNEAQEGGDGGDDSLTIALLLPESKTTRYESFDKPLFEAHVAELCEECEVAYFNADQDEQKQSEQVQSAITQDSDVIVLDPVNGAGAGGMVQSARDADIPVIAYDRFIEGVDYYMSFDNETVGRLQGEALVEAMGGQGNILMLNGAPSDPNAAQFKAGAHSAIDGSGVTILEEYDNPDWSPENAQQFVTDQLSKYDPSQIQGVYAANDGQAGGVVAALTGAGMTPDQLPPITGQDAELAAIQRIVAGHQAMTIYKPIPIEAETAAEVAVKLARGEDVGEETDTGVELTEYEGVDSFIFDPIPVTQDNVADTVVADEFWTAEDICTGEYEAACQEAGIS